MDLQRRIIAFQIENNLKSRADVSDYLRITRPTFNKIFAGEKVSEFTAWKVFCAMQGYVLFEEIAKSTSMKYLKRLQQEKAKILVDNHLRICRSRNMQPYTHGE